VANCPHCMIELSPSRNEHGKFFLCSGCGGRLVSIAYLRGFADPDQLDWVWAQGREGKGEQKTPCPRCNRPMFCAQTTTDPEGLKLDVCRYCALVWFAPGKYKEPGAFAPLSPEEKNAVCEMNKSIKAYGLPGGKALPKVRNPEAEARERLAVDQIKKIAEDGAKYPDELWKVIIAYLGIPVELSDHETKKLPLVTWFLTLAVCVISILSFSELESIVEEYGLVPSVLFRKNGFTLISSFFLHAGWFHLLGNMYFLLVFGSNVEDRLGKFWFLALILLATVAGGFAHSLFHPVSDEPCIGASGGISGVIAFYMLKFPKVKLGFYFWVLWKPIWIRLSAIGFFCFWIFFQLLGVYFQVSGTSKVSALAHLGGVAIGVMFFLISQKKKERKK